MSAVIPVSSNICLIFLVDVLNKFYKILGFKETLRRLREKPRSEIIKKNKRNDQNYH